MNKKLLIPLALLCLLAPGCAKKTTSTTGADAKEYLQLWMDKFHPGINANADGLYILEDIPGTGEDWNSEKAYIFTEATIRSLSGTISSTTDETLAKQLGTYAVGNYYGPKYQAIGSGISYAGVDALLKGMKMGGSRTAVVPAWMLTTSRYNTQQAYIDACTVSTSLIYSITLVGQTDDPDEDAIATLREYVTAVYGQDVQPVSYNTEETADGSFYFISDTSAFDDVETIDDSKSIQVNYTGKLLDGTVFDTTLEKVAKDAGIYSSDKTYTSATMNYSTTYGNVLMGTSSSIINGFKGGISLMKWKGQKATVIFTSKHGYSSSGSGNTIPGFAPLVFELEILAD